jgi:hypothetical protein
VPAILLEGNLKYNGGNNVENIIMKGDIHRLVESVPYHENHQPSIDFTHFAVQI